jgi:hypothetical protein
MGSTSLAALSLGLPRLLAQDGHKWVRHCQDQAPSLGAMQGSGTTLAVYSPKCNAI